MQNSDQKTVVYIIFLFSGTCVVVTHKVLPPFRLCLLAGDTGLVLELWKLSSLQIQTLTLQLNSPKLPSIIEETINVGRIID